MPLEIDAPGVSCPCCAWRGKSLPHHMSKSKECATPRMTVKAPRLAIDTNSELAVAGVKCDLKEKVAVMRVECIMSITHVEQAIRLAEAAVSHTRTLVQRGLHGIPAQQCSQVTSAFDTIMAVIKGLYNVSKTTDEAVGGEAATPIDRSIGPENSRKQWFAFNSSTQLIVDTLAKDKHARKRWVASSEAWKTGDFKAEPPVLSDIVHGSRFRDSPLARKAGLGEEAHVRIGVAVWNDDFTVCDSISHR